jgi:hypothetical protein
VVDHPLVVIIVSSNLVVAHLNLEILMEEPHMVIDHNLVEVVHTQVVLLMEVLDILAAHLDILKVAGHNLVVLLDILKVVIRSLVVHLEVVARSLVVLLMVVSHSLVVSRSLVVLLMVVAHSLVVHLMVVIIVVTASFAVVITFIVVVIVVASFASQDSIIKWLPFNQQQHCFAIIIIIEHVGHNEF